jgi:1-acyl-sn-glycerol-3-phosphate acyltransferase
MKIELRRVPIMGYMAEKIGHICIDRSNPSVAINTINAAKGRITNGTSIFFFPEGTRSDTYEMLPFKKGAFRLAIDMQLPILPVTILGTRYVVPNNTISLFPGKAEIIIHKPIPIEGYSHASMDKLMNDVKAVIESGIK